MAAFSYQLHQPLHNLDSFYNLQSSQMRMPTALLEDPNITTAIFPEFYQPDSLQEIPPKTSLKESSGCILDHSIKVACTLSSNENSLTNKTSTDSSSVTDKLESGEQVTQNGPTMDNKRKSKEAAFVNSVQSKGIGDHARGKKQRKCRRIMKDDQAKKPKEDKKDKKKVAEDAPTGYIHVRARRGQATDSHSLAERVRREKISERMKLLQALVPGCDKVTGKALMLDEIINYVQSLQHQVEFLSMKLASLNPMFYDFGMDLDTFMDRPDQTPNNMVSAAQNMQQCQQMQTPIISNRSTDAAANGYPQLENSSSVLFPQAHHHIPQIFPQANGQLLWDMDDEHRQKLIAINQTGFTSNLCSFH